MSETTGDQDECRALAEEIGPVLGKLTLALRRYTGEALVTPSQGTVLALLLDGAQRITELSRLAGVAQPSMTVLIDRMERQGWVRRVQDEVDRRVVRVEITPDGRQALADVRAARTESLSRRLAGLSEEDRLTIRRALHALARLAEAE